MGLLDKLLGRKKEPEVKSETAPVLQPEPEPEVKPKYAGEVCAYCNDGGADKKFGGRFFHKKCIRAMKKEAKSYVRG
ncbi:MAG: hypothetical protein GOV15_01815 [Candidatus Diapherotrites archaeon]|nr:hypothetical protein [Candidatus Diapherotrites archaeon]